MHLGEVKAPAKPEALVEVEQRHREIRRQRQELEAALRPIESELNRRALGQGDDDTVAKLVSGELARLERDGLPEEARDIRRRLEIIVKADQAVSQRIAQEREKHTNQIARAYRPAHRQATRQILRALEALVEANRAEEAIHATIPGLKLPHMAFPNAGRFGCNGGPAQFWREFALRTYPDLLADEPEPAPAPKARRGLLGRSRANGSGAEAAPMAAKGPED